MESEIPRRLLEDAPRRFGPAAQRVRALFDFAVEVRNKTLRLIAAADPRMLFWTPPGVHTHFLWHAGHVLWVEEVLTMQIATGRTTLPDGWDELFGMGSKPGEHRGQWPSLAAVHGELIAQIPRWVDALAAIRDADLDAPPPFPFEGDRRTLQGLVLHGIHDEANHQGEMHMLRKAFRNLEPERT